MYAKIATRTIVAIAPIARRTVVDSLGTAVPLGAGAGGCSMESALDDRLAALRTELHAAGDLVAVRALEDLGCAALRTEFLSGPDHLSALDARLAARGDCRVGTAGPAEPPRHGEGLPGPPGPHDKRPGPQAEVGRAQASTPVTATSPL